MHVHISEGWFLIDIVHKVHSQGTQLTRLPTQGTQEPLLRLILEERDKVNISYSIEGEERTPKISSQHAI